MQNEGTRFSALHCVGNWGRAENMNFELSLITSTYTHLQVGQGAGILLNPLSQSHVKISRCQGSLFSNKKDMGTDKQDIITLTP